MVPHATLKVYEPLEVFDENERVWWTGYSSASSRRRAPGTLLLSRDHGLGSPEKTLERDEGDVIVDGRTYVCPARTRLRLLASILAFRRSIPAEIVEAFMPQGEAERAAHELQAIRAHYPRWRNHVLLSSWEVPVRWFVAFDDTERVFDQNEPSLRYRTSMQAALRRTADAIEAARNAMMAPQVVGLVSDLAAWLEQFDEGSIVELDYGLLAPLLGPEALEEDHSAADISAAVAALGDGDVVRATAYYMQAVER